MKVHKALSPHKAPCHLSGNTTYPSWLPAEQGNRVRLRGRDRHDGVAESPQGDLAAVHLRPHHPVVGLDEPVRAPLKQRILAVKASHRRVQSRLVARRGHGSSRRTDSTRWVAGVRAGSDGDVWLQTRKTKKIQRGVLYYATTSLLPVYQGAKVAWPKRATTETHRKAVKESVHA
jgi:hypothetical protein